MDGIRGEQSLRKRKTLPKNFDELIAAGDLSALKEVFIRCELDARGGYRKSPALSFFNIPDELVRWLVEQGADVNAGDKYEGTALHEHAVNWCGNIELLLELGADIEALDYQNETPLFAAAGSFRLNWVQILIEKGANISAENKMQQTPLEHALMRCRNADIVDMAKVAELLLDAGATITRKMKDEVKRIGTDLEFHRDNFNKDYLHETDEALAHLYALFNSEPIEARKMHDGVSPIIVSANSWQDQHQELWNLLIPSQGCADTVQGEVIRITGKVSYEIMGNGGMNWDGEYRKMLESLNDYFSMGLPLNLAGLQETKSLVEKLYNGYGDKEPARLCELAVHWVLDNPNPITLEQPNYKR